jgi:hypothetical protein
MAFWSLDNDYSDDEGMKMFSDCRGECAICGCGGGCLAGHGDDDWCPATETQLTNRLNNNEYGAYRDLMIKTLKEKFGVYYAD